MGVSRIFIGAHYCSDVLFSFSISLALTFVFYRALFYNSEYINHQLDAFSIAILYLMSQEKHIELH